MEILNFLALPDLCSDSSNALFIFQAARWIIRIIQIAVPFALIIWGSLDFFKAVIAGDEKEMKQKRKPFVQRLVAAVIILLLPTIVNLVLKNVAKNYNNEFAECWTAAASNPDIPELSGDDWETE